MMFLWRMFLSINWCQDFFITVKDWNRLGESKVLGEVVMNFNELWKAAKTGAQKSLCWCDILDDDICYRINIIYMHTIVYIYICMCLYVCKYNICGL